MMKLCSFYYYNCADMRARFFIVIFFAATCTQLLAGGNIKQVTRKPIYWDGTTYDYDYRQENVIGQQRGGQKHDSTPRRPIMQYFRTILEKAQVSWNLTNPFSHIFKHESSTHPTELHENSQEATSQLQIINENGKKKRVHLLNIPYGMHHYGVSEFSNPNADPYIDADVHIGMTSGEVHVDPEIIFGQNNEYNPVPFNTYSESIQRLEKKNPRE